MENRFSKRMRSMTIMMCTATTGMLAMAIQIGDHQAQLQAMDEKMWAPLDD